MVAAYAVALQVLLTGVIVSQHSGAAIAGSFGIICDASGIATGDQGNAPAPGHAQSCTACPLGMGSLAVLPTAEALVDYADTEVIPHRPTARSAGLARHPTPRLSQGPPHLT